MVSAGCSSDCALLCCRRGTEPCLVLFSALGVPRLALPDEGDWGLVAVVGIVGIVDVRFVCECSPDSGVAGVRDPWVYVVGECLMDCGE